MAAVEQSRISVDARIGHGRPAIVEARIRVRQHLSALETYDFLSWNNPGGPACDGLSPTCPGCGESRRHGVGKHGGKSVNVAKVLRALATGPSTTDRRPARLCCVPNRASSRWRRVWVASIRSIRVPWFGGKVLESCMKDCENSRDRDPEPPRSNSHSFARSW